MRRLLAGARLFTGDRMLDGHALLTEGERITAVLPVSEAPADVQVRRLPADTLLVPGFLDVQVNGAGGVLFNDTPTAEAALAIAAVVRRTGTTGILPTFMTDERDKMRQACDAAVQALAHPRGGVRGLHLEGPFLAVERPGVHPPEWIRRPDAEDIDALVALATDRIAPSGRLLLTVAPETIDDRDIERLAAAGVTVAAGHTAATVERTCQALAAGLRGFTHLFNAMPPLVNRHPGPVAAALADPDAWCSIIADGHHVHPALLRLLVHIKPQGKVILVTDAMPPSGTDATSFNLFGRTVLRHDGRLATEDGTLAGADIDMATSVRNCVDLLGLPLEESLRMASLYPARYIGLDRELGSLTPGHRADLTLLRPDLTVLATWVAGEEEWYGRDGEGDGEGEGHGEGRGNAP
ncbi:MAG TPA: N-acetylglucosamine-6-phosphate deacetylase [Kofleriaceae bacterium]|nr:N-acetylglucosamine-6-phosphate deacetylase [Kofleriaceae bacterium]